MDECIKDQLAVIDLLAERKPQYRQVLGVYRHLLEIMNEVSIPPVELSFRNDLENTKRQAGLPLFQRDTLPIDLKASSDLLASFMERLSRTEREDRQGLIAALEKLRNEPEWGVGLFQTILREDPEGLTGFAQEAGLDPNGLQFLAQMALGPAMEALRCSLAERIDTENWDYGYCPLCGSKPDMAYFGRSGKRFLHCELCGTHWYFQRIGCPFCSNQEQEELGYLEAEEEEGLRVYFCKKCRKYLKTVDTRVFEKPAPIALENLLTLHLDMLAEENGFR